MRAIEFLEMALSYLNYPASNYRGPLKGLDTDGFDCSGFVFHVLKKAGYPDYIPRHASDFFDSFGIYVHEQFRSIGDLVFFSNRGGTYPDHVGILVSRNAYIHSPGRNGKAVCVCKLEKEIIKPSGKSPQIYFNNPIGYKRIAVKDGRYKKIFLS